MGAGEVWIMINMIGRIRGEGGRCRLINVVYGMRDGEGFERDGNW
jgi:hypothetical protein